MSKIFNSAQKVQNISGNPNLIINGNFNIWQRGPLHSATGYNADRWVGIITGGVAFSKINAVALRNSSFAMRIATTKNSSSFVLKQIIETNNVIFIRGKTVVLSFYAKIPDEYKGQNNNWGSSLLRASVLVNSDAIDSIVGATEIASSVTAVSLSSGWQKFSISFDVPDNSQTIVVQFKPSVSTLDENSVCDITQIKLELGSTSTNYDDILYTDELRKCQRYYQKVELDIETGAQVNQPFGLTLPLLAELRTSNPTIIFETQNNKGINNISTLMSNNKQALKIKGNATSSSVSLNSTIVIDGELGFGSVPSAVSNAQSTRDSNNDTMTLFWTEPDDNGLAIDAYIIKYGNSPNSLTSSLTTNTASGIISGVLDHLTYYYTIQASNYLGLGSLSSTYISGPDMDLPQPPTDLLASWGYNNHTLSWSAPIDNGGSPILHYHIQRSTSPDFLQNLFSTNTDISPDPVSTITLSNPQSSNNYYFRVASINAMGTGNYSSSIFLQRTAPSFPASIATSTLNSGVVLSWSNPSHNGGSPIVGYTINHSSSTGFPSATVASVGASSTATLTALPNGVTRYFRIAATNSIGTSAWSSVVFATPNQPPATAYPPQNLRASWSDPSLVNIIFDEPRSDGGTPIVSYNIQLASNSGFTQNVINFNTTSPASQKTYSVAVPVSGSLSGFYIRGLSLNAVGSGSYSQAIFLTKGAPPAPTITSITPGNGSMDIRWIPSSISSGVPITGFTVDRSTSSSFSSVSSVTLPVNLDYQQYYTTGLTNNTNYYFRIRALTSSGVGPYSSSITGMPKAPATTPSIPRSLNINRIAETGISFSFSSSSNNGGSAITGYTFAYTTGTASGVSISPDVYFSGSNVTYVEVLPSRANYSNNIPITYNSGILAAIRANNSVGSSNWTSFVFKDLYLVQPGIPTGVAYTESVSHIGSGIGTISWKDPINWGGEPENINKTYNVKIFDLHPYYGYQLKYNLTQIEYSNNIDNSITVSGLVPGVQHMVELKAKNRTFNSSVKSITFTPTNLVKPQNGGWTLSVPTPITDSTVLKSQSWDYFRGYAIAANMDNDNRQLQNNIWVSLEMYKTSTTRFYGSYLRYTNTTKPSDNGLWIKATFPGNGVYVSRVQYATPLPGIYIPTDFTGFNNSKTILTDSLAINSLHGALLQYSTDNTNWTTATTLSVPNTSDIHTYQLGEYPVYCKYIRIYLPYLTENFGKRLAIGILNFE